MAKSLTAAPFRFAAAALPKAPVFQTGRPEAAFRKQKMDFLDKKERPTALPVREHAQASRAFRPDNPSTKNFMPGGIPKVSHPKRYEFKK